MAAKLSVTTDVGVFTRRTERTYTHIVVARGLRPDWIHRRFTAELAYSRKLVARYQAVVDGGPILDGTGEWQRPNYPEYVATEQRHIDTHDARLAQWLADSAASTHGIVGWCGRLDLARKLAAKTTADRLDVRIFQLDGQEVR